MEEEEKTKIKVKTVSKINVEQKTQKPEFTHEEINLLYEKGLNIMDMTAFTLCQENDLPIIVFNMNKPGNLLGLVKGENAGTLIS